MIDKKIKHTISLISLSLLLLGLPIKGKCESLSDPHDSELRDIIYLSDGSELVVKIITLGTSSVVFEQFDTNDPFTIDVENIDHVRLKNGNIKRYKEPETKKKTTSSTSKSKKRTKKRSK